MLEEEPSPKKGGRKGRQSAPAKKGSFEEDLDEEMQSKTTRGGKKSTRGTRGRGKASIASQRSVATTSRRGQGKKVEEESLPQAQSQEVSNLNF
jgi:hypothetical protein